MIYTAKISEKHKKDMVLPDRNSQNPTPKLLLQQLKKEPHNPVRLVQLGIKLFSSGKKSEALLCFMRATIQSPDDPNVFEKIAICLNAMGIHRESVRYSEAALAVGGKTPQLIETLIEGYRQLDKTHMVNALLKKYGDTALASRYVLLLYVAILHLEGDLIKAAEVAEKARLKSPKNAYTRAVIETLQAAKSMESIDSGENRPKIAFHLNEGFHISIMGPIFDVLKSDYNVLMTADPFWISAFQPVVVFVANSQAENLRQLMPNAKFIYTRHGLISKNFIYGAARHCDYICVSSEDQRRQFIEQSDFKLEQIWVTGYAQMDPLFQGSNLSVDLPLRHEVKCILYAPTFTEGLSSVPLLIANFDKAYFDSLGDVDLILKLHPLTIKSNPRWMAGLKKIAALSPNIHLVTDRDANVVAYMKQADILVSDVSSVMFQYLALDRPIIAINNPDRFNVPEYDPNGIEWRWRDMACEVEGMKDLQVEILRNLANPALKKTERSVYRKSLFGTLTDGQTGRRVLKHVKGILPDLTEGSHD